MNHAAQKFPEFVEKIQADGESTRGDIKEIRGQLKEVGENVSRILEFIFGKRTIVSSSPMRLTDFGKMVADRLKAEQWAATLAPTLLDKVAGKKPFELDAYADSYSKRHLSDDMKTRVKACGYEFGINTDAVQGVLRVVLRDELLRLTGQEADN